MAAKRSNLRRGAVAALLLVTACHPSPSPAVPAPTPSPTAAPEAESAAQPTGSCWVLGDGPRPWIAGDTRYTYHAGKLRRFEVFDPAHEEVRKATVFHYDSAGKLVREEIVADGRIRETRRYDYDGSGRLSRIAGSDRVRVFRYGPDGLASETERLQSGQVYEATVTWRDADGGGRIVRVQRSPVGARADDPKAFEESTVDPAGRLVSYEEGIGTCTVREEQEYDAEGHCTLARRDDGCDGNFEWQLETKYDAAGVPRGATERSGFRSSNIELQADDRGNVTRVRRLTESGELLRETRYTYDGEFTAFTCPFGEPLASPFPWRRQPYL